MVEFMRIYLNRRINAVMILYSLRIKGNAFTVLVNIN